MRKSFHLRSELFPYIYSSAAQSCRESVPLTRPMYIDYPNDENAYQNPQQFMRDYPNTQVAREVREVIDTLRQRAQGIEPEMAPT